MQRKYGHYCKKYKVKDNWYITAVGKGKSHDQLRITVGDSRPWLVDIETLVPEFSGALGAPEGDH